MNDILVTIMILFFVGKKKVKKKFRAAMIVCLNPVHTVLEGKSTLKDAEVKHERSSLPKTQRHPANTTASQNIPTEAAINQADVMFVPSLEL